MKVEVSNRPYWIEQFQNELDYILRVRALNDLKYEKKWRKRWFLPNRGEDEFPHRDHDISSNYPSWFGWMRIDDIKRIIKLLESDTVGAIYLSNEDLDLINWGTE